MFTNCVIMDCSRAKSTIKITSAYRMLQVLNNRFNACFSKLIMPFLFLTVLMLNILTNFATVRLYHEVKMPAYISFPCCSISQLLIVFEAFPISYKVYDSSQSLIRNTLNGTRKNGYTHKLMASCKPLQVWVGNYFIIKRRTIMTYLEIAISNTVLLLLNIK